MECPEKITTGTCRSEGQNGDDVEDSTIGDQQPKLSKNQLKKMRRLEMKLKLRPEKRKLERERKKEKRKQAKLMGLELPPTRKQLKETRREAIDISVVIDSSFEDYMSEAETRKLIKQIQRCYALNRRSEEPFKLHVTSFGGKVKEIIDNYVGASNWDVTWSAEPYHKTFPLDNIVYLSAESANILDTLEMGKAYIIGGLVDHNAHKGLCHRLAEENKIAHAQLPISDYIHMKTRKVLTVDHVFEILMQYHKLKDWKEAFLSVIPKRKGVEEKVNDDECEKDNSEEADKAGDGDHENTGDNNPDEKSAEDSTSSSRD